METRLIPVIDASGLRSYREATGETYFEAVQNINSLLDNGDCLDTDLLELSEQEIRLLEKQSECTRIRKQIGEINDKKVEAIATNRNPRQYLNQINGLSAQLWRLEREIKKACP
ncbi:hypothetical protein ACU1JV_26815 [Paenibacillus sp. T2-29]